MCVFSDVIKRADESGRAGSCSSRSGGGVVRLADAASESLSRAPETSSVLSFTPCLRRAPVHAPWTSPLVVWSTFSNLNV